MEKTSNINLGVSDELKGAIEEYSETRGISQASTVRMILRENIPTLNEGDPNGS